MLSSIVSKGYIFLLIKVYVRVIGFDVIRSLGICDVCSSSAPSAWWPVQSTPCAQDDPHDGGVFLRRADRLHLRRAGAGQRAWHALRALAYAGALGDEIHAVHLRAHAGSRLRRHAPAQDLRGGFYRSPLAAAAFTLGAANLVGVPMLSVFVTKVTMAQAAVMTGRRHTVIALARWRFHAAQRLLLPGHDDAALYPGSRAPGAQRPREDQRLCGPRGLDPVLWRSTLRSFARRGSLGAPA